MFHTPAHKQADPTAYPGQRGNVVTLADYVRSVTIDEANLVPTALPPADALAELLVAVDNLCRSLRSQRDTRSPHQVGCMLRIDAAVSAAHESLVADARARAETDRRAS